MGPSGSGKTTFAGQIAARLGWPHTELDALHWLPDWQQAPLKQFRARVAQAVAGDAWVVDGNYDKVRDLVWARVETVIFLDFPLWLCMGRLVRRTSRRVFGRQTLWSGNRETLREALFSRDSLFLYTLRTYRRRRRNLLAAMQDPQYSHIQFLRFRAPHQAGDWLAKLTAL